MGYGVCFRLAVHIPGARVKCQIKRIHSLGIKKGVEHFANFDQYFTQSHIIAFVVRTSHGLVGVDKMNFRHLFAANISNKLRTGLAKMFEWESPNRGGSVQQSIPGLLHGI